MVVVGRWGRTRGNRAGTGLQPPVPLVAALAALALPFAGTPPARADAGPSLPPPEIAVYQFVTRSLDATGTLVNPAGLARGKGSNLYLDLTGDGTEILEGSAGIQGGGWAFTYRHRDLTARSGGSVLGVPFTGDRNLDTYAFAAGFGPPRFQLGISRVWTNVDLPGEDAGAWNAGFLSRPSPRISAGLTVENIQHPRFLDGRLTPRYTYALSMSLLPSRPNLLVLTGQGSHLDGASDRIDVSGGISSHLPSGLDLALVVRRPFGGDLEIGGSITRGFGKGAASARARSVSGTDQVRGQLALQIYDQFWQRTHDTGPETSPNPWPRPKRGS